MVAINNSLNLVIPIETPQGVIYAHSCPIAHEVFDRFYFVIGKCWSRLFKEGLGEVAGPRIAAKLLRDIAKADGILDGEGGVDLGLLREIQRLTNILLPKDTGGWQTLPFEEAVHRHALTAEDASEVENAAVFFTLGWSMLRRNVREIFVTGAAELWGAQTTSLNTTEFCASLPTSTGTENSGKTKTMTEEKASLPPH